MDEHVLLEHIYRRSRGIEGGAILLGPGDDCAVLEGDLLVTVDQLVEGRHYEPGTEPDLIVRKAVGRAVSDIAAMGGTPTCAFAAASLGPHETDEDGLFDRMANWALRFGSPLAGGDISRVDGPSVFTLTILGRAHAARGPVTRAGAMPGDGVYITGAMGGAVSSGRHLTPEPRIREGAWLCDTLGAGLTSMIDLSDGLGRDVGRVARASGVSIEIDRARVPMHEDAPEFLRAIAEGEDYELLFTASGVPDEFDQPPGSAPITRIGRVVKGDGTVTLTGDTGERTDITELGWDHTP